LEGIETFVVGVPFNVPTKVVRLMVTEQPGQLANPWDVIPETR
jgi:hypothetical protein